jgi:hypothetical protein
VKSKLPLILYCLILLWLALGIFSMHVPAHTFWPAGFIAYSMPIPLLLNACFLLFWLFKRSRAALLPLLVLVLTFGYLKRGLALHPVKQNQEAESGPLYPPLGKHWPARFLYLPEAKRRHSEPRKNQWRS